MRRRLMATTEATLCANVMCVLALWMAAPPTARAGIELTTEIGGTGAAAQGQPKPPRSGRMLLDGDRVRMEVTGTGPKGDAKTVMIYRGDRNVMWSVDDTRKAYTEIDAARMQAMRAQSDAARAQMRGGLDKLPPAERARMQAMLAAADAKGAGREPPTIKETGRADKVGALACHELEVSRGGVKESDICVADWKAAGVTKADLTPVGKLGRFQSEAFGGMQARGESDDVLELFDSLDGLPVRVRSYHGGQLRAEFRVVKVERKPLDTTLFDVPEGYQKRAFAVSMPGAPKAPGAAGAPAASGAAPGSPAP
jgi:hypothetical protein